MSVFALSLYYKYQNAFGIYSRLLELLGSLYICIYICINIYMYICVCVCVCVCICTHLKCEGRHKKKIICDSVVIWNGYLLLSGV